MKLKIPIILSLFFLISCAELTQIAQSVASQNLPLTNAEIVGGLKDALLVGTDSEPFIGYRRLLKGSGR